MKTFVIGDVHGCSDQLEELLEVIRPDLTQDRLIMLGDYIDRGPQCHQALQTVIKLQRTFGREQVILLRGNHEQMAIDYLERNDCSYLNNGGGITLADFRKHGDSLANYLDFFKNLPTHFEDDHCIYVHAGIRPGISLAKQDDSDLLWIRSDFYGHPATESKTVVFGHTPTRNLNQTWQPYMNNGKIGIDTGCVYGGCLSAIEMENGQLTATHQSAKIAA